VADSPVGIREGTDSDIPAAVDLLKTALGEGAIPRSTEFWNWKHAISPFGKSPFWVAESEGRLVGVRVFLRWTWDANGRRVSSVRAVDTATHPDYQGKGIFRNLTLTGVEELKREGVAFVFNTPNAKSRPGYLKMGWSTVGRTSLWVAPRSLAPAVRVARSRLRRHAAPGRLDDEDPTEAANPDLLTRNEVTKLLVSAGASSDRYRTPVDAAYLEWRYIRCPGYRYGFTLGDRGSVLAVHRTRRRAGAREVAFCELLHDDAASVRDIAAVVRRVLRDSLADYGVMAPPRSARVAGAMVLCGFIPGPRIGPILTVRPMNLSAAVPDPRSIRSWDMTLGSLELF
jgi:GNAT superfamily N-acetyltransferase